MFFIHKCFELFQLLASFIAEIRARERMEVEEKSFYMQNNAIYRFLLSAGHNCSIDRFPITTQIA